MDAPRTRVLYLIGTTRCGSTLIGSLLGQVPGVVHVGELARIWEEGLVQNHRCGCGAPFADCAFWTAVLDRAFGGRDGIDPRRMTAIVAGSARTRHAGRLATRRGRERMRADMAEYTEATARLYHAVAAVAGATTVLDSSKTPLLGWLATGRADLDFWALHVTRDPRAVAYSWQRRKFDPAKGEDMHRENTIATSLGWVAWNGLAASLWSDPVLRDRYLHVRYEDLAAEPHAVLDRILGWLGDRTPATALIGEDRCFRPALAHTIAGNPMRFDRKSRPIAIDTEWRQAASRRDKLLVASLTWPLLGKYRYPLLA
jgi:hypothetical protein